MSNSAYEEWFNEVYQWWNKLEDFWTTFNASSAFAWFDCEHGNGDGYVSFAEYESGMEPYLDDYDCYDQLHDKWVYESGNTTSTVLAKDYFKRQRRLYNKYWKALAGKNATNVTYADFTNNALEKLDLD